MEPATTPEPTAVPVKRQEFAEPQCLPAVRWRRRVWLGSSPTRQQPHRLPGRRNGHFKQHYSKHKSTARWVKDADWPPPSPTATGTGNLIAEKKVSGRWNEEEIGSVSRDR